MEHLRQTETNQGEDFAGLLWGIPLPLFPLLILSLVLGLIFGFAAPAHLDLPTGWALLIGLLPVGATFFLLRQYGQQPRGTARDQFENVITGGDCSPFDSRPQP